MDADADADVDVTDRGLTAPAGGYSRFLVAMRTGPEPEAMSDKQNCYLEISATLLVEQLQQRFSLQRQPLGSVSSTKCGAGSVRGDASESLCFR